MYLKDRLTSCQIRQFYGNTSVKSSGTKKCRIKGLRPVGSCQNDNTLRTVKAIHLRQELVQRLLSFIISSHPAGITLFTDGINLVNKYDAGCFFICLLKQISYLCCTHAHKHLYKFRAGNREERNIGFPCHCFCKQCLTGSGRANQQCPFWHGCTDFLILLRIMEKIYDLLQDFLCLILSCHITKINPCRGFHIYFGIALSKLHGRHSASHFFHDLGRHPLSQSHKNDDWQYPADNKA